MGFNVRIDPLNVMVYSNTAMENQQCGVPFGFISLPKLEGRRVAGDNVLV
jgi:hypothetical protein